LSLSSWEIKKMREAPYLAQLKAENADVNAISDAAFQMLRKRRDLKGSQAVLSEIGALQFCHILIDYLSDTRAAYRIAAERLLRQELWYAYDLGYIDVIYKIEPQITMIDL